MSAAGKSEADAGLWMSFAIALRLTVGWLFIAVGVLDLVVELDRNSGPPRRTGRRVLPRDRCWSAAWMLLDAGTGWHRNQGGPGPTSPAARSSSAGNGLLISAIHRTTDDLLHRSIPGPARVPVHVHRPRRGATLAHRQPAPARRPALLGVSPGCSSWSWSGCSGSRPQPAKEEARRTSRRSRLRNGSTIEPIGDTSSIRPARGVGRRASGRKQAERTAGRSSKTVGSPLQ